jgi:RNA polymerase sigma-70 factor, ECF subfamily
MEAASRHAATIIDPKLLSRVAKGDIEAFNQLYEQSNVLLFTLAYRILGSREEAALLLQEVYLEVWRKVARYDVGRGTPVAWLVTLTRSRAIERIRSGVSRGSTPVADCPTDASTPSRQFQQPVPADTAMESELRPLLNKAIAELPAAQQEAVEMAYYHGLSHSEIATKLNQPLGTVKTRIKLAMIKLRASLHSALEQHHP